MKKTFLFFSVLCMFASFDNIIHAQVNDATNIENNATNKHMTFKGIPLNTPVKDFIAKLQADGYDLRKEEKELVMLKGSFARYNDCLIGLKYFSNQKIVYKATVVFEERETWEGLLNQYENLKSMLTEKYVENATIKEIEEIDTYKPKINDEFNLTLLKLGKVKYITHLKTPEGDIFLEISSNRFVTLTYFDNINAAKAESAAMDDL